ncbi:hypothetical protein [Ralstonia phage phiRSL1]|uniref:Uncharacterized protein n=1 Tax=Ralstonia phage phiRSL1 TaxID=1980924 RepID=B2ZY36_9CAUD|nr:hypothetical protein RSL1_ORF165 [Ralstonia phage phiRSL1]BAG41612.1 hypothetical protein [Ralstonia phage phiRSL1]
MRRRWARSTVEVEVVDLSPLVPSQFLKQWPEAVHKEKAIGSWYPSAGGPVDSVVHAGPEEMIDLQISFDGIKKEHSSQS